MSATYTDLQFTTFPDAIQDFVTFLNMTVADAENVNNFQKAMQEGDYTTAQNYFNQITNGNQKILDANKINTLIDTCKALQRFYQTDIAPYVENKQEEFDNTVSQFSYMGEYSAEASYLKNNFVSSNISGLTQLYICIKNAPSGTSVVNQTYWRQLTLRGEQGRSGSTLSFRYAWDSSKVYSVQDAVTYNNSIWGCTTENSNQAPYSGSPYWTLIYTAQQVIYPFSSTTPSVSQIGSLWFKIVE